MQCHVALHTSEEILQEGTAFLYQSQEKKTTPSICCLPVRAHGNNFELLFPCYSEIVFIGQICIMNLPMLVATNMPRPAYVITHSDEETQHTLADLV